MLDSNHAGHPDDDDEWQTTFSSWDRYGKIVVDFSPVLSITYLSTETWHGNSNFENNSNTHHTKKRRTKRKIQKRNSFTEENYRRLQISLPVHIQNACSTFRILVSKAIILGLATKRKEKKRKENAHGIAQIPPYLLRWNTRLEQGDTRGGAARRGLYCCYQTGCAGNRGTCCHYCHGFPTSLRAPKGLQSPTKQQQNAPEIACKIHWSSSADLDLSLALSLSLSFAKQLSSLHNCAEQEQERRDAVVYRRNNGKTWR